MHPRCHTQRGSHPLEGAAADATADWHRFNTPSKPRRLPLELQLPFTWWGGGGTVGGRGEREEQLWLSGGTVVTPLWQGISTEPPSVQSAHRSAGETAPGLRQQSPGDLICQHPDHHLGFGLSSALSTVPLEKRDGSSYRNCSLQHAGSLLLQ